ncbi:MAG: hypothetical protein U0X39_01720 [Bacteroidales bacterium]
MKKFILTTMLLVFVAGMYLKAQDPVDTTKVYRFEMKDGNTFTGKIMREDMLYITINSEKYGEVRLAIDEIKSRKELQEVITVDGKVWLPNPQSSRYFWGPNGFGLSKGEAYYQNIWILYNQASVGLTNNFSVGAGILPLFLFNGAPTPMFLVPKFSIPVVKDKFNIGTGAFLGTVLGEDTGVFGLMYGTGTVGSRDKNVSLGFAYGFAQDSWMDRPVINLSTMIRTGPRGYFISENYYFPIEGENLLLVSMGGRTIIRNVGLDYSLWLPFFEDMDGFVAIPFIGISIPFGKTNH